MEEESFRDLALLSRVAVAANEAITTGEATGEIVAMLARHVAWPAATAWLRDRGDGVLRCSGAWYVEEGHDLDRLRNAVESRLLVAPGSMAGRVGRSGAPVWIERAIGDPAATDGWLSGDEESGVDSELGIGAAFAVPVWFGREVVGVIGMFRPAPTPRDDAVLELVEQVATQLGCVVGRTRAMVHKAPIELAAAAADRRVLLAAVERMWQSLSSIAHEIRTPLNGVVGSLELLLAVTGEAVADRHERNALAESALESASRLHDMIERRLIAAESELTASLHEPDLGD